MEVKQESHYVKYGRKHYEKHKQKYLEKQREYYASRGKELKLEAYPERWKREIFRRYGITEEDYQELLLNQEGKCKICRAYPKEGKRLDVDHNHKTNKVRGLLCNNCNRGLGHFKDNPEYLDNALKYLNELDITGHGGSCGV